MNADAILLLATILIHLLGVITLHLAAGLLALVPVALTVAGLRVAIRQEAR